MFLCISFLLVCSALAIAHRNISRAMLNLYLLLVVDPSSFSLHRTSPQFVLFFVFCFSFMDSELMEETVKILCHCNTAQQEHQNKKKHSDLSPPIHCFVYIVFMTRRLASMTVPDRGMIGMMRNDRQLQECDLLTERISKALIQLAVPFSRMKSNDMQERRACQRVGQQQP